MATAGGGLRTLFTLPDSIHGKGKVVFTWNADGTLLCSSGSNGLVYIHSRDGRKVCDVLLESRAPCVALDWDKDGEAVAIVQAGVDRVAVWEVSSRAVYYIDSGLRDPSWAKWSKVGPQLAVGSTKGALMIFRKDTRKKHLLPTKHSKAIVCGDWSSDNKLALGSADVMLTISNADGDTIEQVELKYPPEAVQFATEKSDAVYNRGGGRASPTPDGPGGMGIDTTVSVNMGGNTILLYNLLKPTEPAELLFQQRYGRIVAYRWFGDGYVMLGFSEGYVVVISTHKDEIKEEVFSGRFHREPLEDIACSVPAQRAASAGGSMIKLLDMSTWKELKGEFALTDPAHGPITSLAWTPDGQILTASTRSGHLYSFLGKVPALVSAWTGGGGGEGPYNASKIAHMSSLKEVSVLSLTGKGFVDEEAPPIVVPIAVEPDLIAVGPLAVAAGMNNRVWYYRATANAAAGGNILLCEKDYVGTVEEVKLTATHAVVKTSGRLFIHPLAPPPSSPSAASSAGSDPTTASYTLPQRDDGASGGNVVTCFAVAGEFVVYGTSLGRVEMFSLSDGRTLTSHEFRGTPASAGAVAPPGIRGVYPNAIGTRIIVLDDAGRSFLFNPVDGRKLSLEGILPTNLVGASASAKTATSSGQGAIGGGASNGGSSQLCPIIWDAKDRNVFVTVGVGARTQTGPPTSSPSSAAAVASSRGGSGGITLEIATFLYTPVSMMGPSVTQLGSLDIQDNGDMVVDPLATYLPSLHCAPLALQGGVICYHSAAPPSSTVSTPTAAGVAAHRRGGFGFSSSAGSIATAVLETHNALPSLNTAVSLSDPKQVKLAFAQCVALSRLQEAWGYAVTLNSFATAQAQAAAAAGAPGQSATDNSSSSASNNANRPIWMALSGKAMELLEVELAQRVYRSVGDAGMVAALEQISKLDDKQAVAGHMALLFGDLPVAQELFLGSSSSAIALLALDMRKDLMQWDIALKLAETLSPDQVPSISLDVARQLEVKGDYAAALAMYQSALSRLNAVAAAAMNGAAASPANAQLKASIHAGLTRMTLRQGDLRKGVTMALESGDKVLCRDCAAILEGMKQYADAATLYKQAEMWEKAVALLLQGKNFAAAGQLMDRITTPKLHAIYAKACEATKNYVEAAKAYERARDFDAVVRILLNHLDSPEKAAAIVRQTRSADGAGLLAKYCVSNGDFRGAIEFLLLARRREDAFQLACEHNEMNLYVQALKLSLAASAAGIDLASLLLSAASEGVGGSGGLGAASEAALGNVVLPRDECIKIAGYYEKKGDIAAAADMFAAIPSSPAATGSESSAANAAALAEEDLALYTKALKLYLQVASKTATAPAAAGAPAAPTTDPAAAASTKKYIDKAIDVVGKAKNDAVTRVLIDYLMGESDGIPKDPRHIFRLYMALGNYSQAAKTALIIAHQEQGLGNYKVAHDILFDTYADLVGHGVKVGQDLVSSLTLLHSYLLVKRLVKLENHDAAAAMMVRVASNVSRFPQHVVPILTSTVIECQRAGLKRSAFDYSVMLMRPEYRDAVEPKFYKKIEALVRRPSTEEADQGSSPCPFCERNVSTYSLSCDFCKSRLPFCVVSGRHMTVEDCSCCPSCKFPALLPALQSYLTIETSCPMCNEAIKPEAVALVPDPAAFLRKAASAVTGEGGGDDE